MYTAEMVACILADYAELRASASDHEASMPTLIQCCVWDVETALDAGHTTVPAIVAYLNGRAK